MDAYLSALGYLCPARLRRWAGFCGRVAGCACVRAWGVRWSSGRPNYRAALCDILPKPTKKKIQRTVDHSPPLCAARRIDASSDNTRRHFPHKLRRRNISQQKNSLTGRLEPPKNANEIAPSAISPAAFPLRIRHRLPTAGVPELICGSWRRRTWRCLVGTRQPPERLLGM